MKISGLMNGASKSLFRAFLFGITCIGTGCEDNSSGSPSVPKYWVAFFNHGGTISIVDEDGKNLKVIADGKLPQWSPDGGRIVYQRYIKGAENVWILNVSDTSKTSITNDSVGGFNPQWSPDGKKIVFESLRSGNREIYISNSDGSSQLNLSNMSSDDSQPLWSPDGMKIIFVSFTNSSKSDIWIMDSDGNNKINLTNGIGRNIKPVFSPLGDKIAFLSDRDSLANKIHVMGIDGADVKKLSDTPASEIPVSWSHDELKLLFTGEVIYKMNADGTGIAPLTIKSQIYHDYSPIWAPDDSKIVFVSTRTYYHDIFVMDADGKNVIQVSSKTGDNVFPVWSPVKK